MEGLIAVILIGVVIAAMVALFACATCPCCKRERQRETRCCRCGTSSGRVIPMRTPPRDERDTVHEEPLMTEDDDDEHASFPKETDSVESFRDAPPQKKQHDVDVDVAVESGVYRIEINGDVPPAHRAVRIAVESASLPRQSSSGSITYDAHGVVEYNGKFVGSPVDSLPGSICQDASDVLGLVPASSSISLGFTSSGASPTSLSTLSTYPSRSPTQPPDRTPHALLPWPARRTRGSCQPAR